MALILGARRLPDLAEGDQKRSQRESTFRTQIRICQHEYLKCEIVTLSAKQSKGVPERLDFAVEQWSCPSSAFQDAQAK